MEDLELTLDQIEALIRENAHVRGEVTHLEDLAFSGAVAVDIGGNRGLTAIRLAQAAGPTGRVHAFEPVPEFCDALRNNVERNRINNVTCCSCALGNHNGSMRFFQHGQGSGIVPEAESPEIEVRVVSLDSYVQSEGIERVDVMSMDCEGSELFVFEGAESVLRRYHPGILCEIHHGTLARLEVDAARIVRHLEDRGYTVTPISVDNPEGPISVETCSHILAVARPEAH